MTERKVYICKGREDWNGEYMEFDDPYYLNNDDIYFDARHVIWDDFTRANFDIIDHITFEEIRKKFFKFEKEWVAMEPNWGISIKRSPAGLLI